MSPPKEDGLALVFGKPKGGKDPEPPMGDEPDGMGEDDGGGLDAACSEMLEHLGIALPPEKEKAFCEALKNFVQMVDEEPHEEGPDMGEEGEE